MMHDFNRDLLLLSRSVLQSPEEFDRQMQLLNAMLHLVENWPAFCTANELVDINRSKIISTPIKIEALFRKGPLRPFIFISNKN